MLKSRKNTVKTNFSAKTYDPLPNILYYHSKSVGSDVWLVDISYRWIRAEFDQNIEHMSNPPKAVMNHGVKLTVGKCPGTAFTELDI